MLDVGLALLHTLSKAAHSQDTDKTLIRADLTLQATRVEEGLGNSQTLLASQTLAQCAGA
jgi:hypothetical protein